MITLVAATQDANKQAVLTFQWDPFVPASGLSRASYKVTLWSDEARSFAIAGGATQHVTGAQASFGGVPRGLPFIAEVAAVDTAGTVGPAQTLIQVSPANAPSTAPDFLSDEPGSGEGESEGILSPLRPVYGTVDGVKRWARAVTFGDGKGQVSALDVLYFLMVASDDADGEFSQRYAVPLTKYRDAATGLFRYPPPLPGLIERKAAGLLLYSRKSVLSDQESGIAVGLMTYADRRITDIAANDYMIGQTLTAGVLPRVANSVPRQFSMAGDPAGLAYSPVVGSTDVRSVRPHALLYASYGWSYGGGQIDDLG